LNFSAASVSDTKKVSAVLSIALNLSDGSAKKSEKERRRFYEIAFGSLREVQTIVEILDLGEIRGKCDRLAARLATTSVSASEKIWQTGGWLMAVS
jgi:four helix bundle protein